MQQFYMVEFELPSMMAPEFLARIPEQRNRVDELMAEGRIRSYSLAVNRSRLWMIVVADSDFEVMQLIGQLPLIDFMIPSINPLMFHHSMEALMAVSLN
jgi:muconolactone delta-isomerase